MHKLIISYICGAVFLSLSLCSLSNAAILVFEPNGQYTSKRSLTEAATAADVAGKTVVITSPQLVDSVISWPSDRELRFEKGGYISFSGSGSLTGLKEVRPEWFGAKSDGSDASIAVNNVALQASFNASKTVLLSAGTYKFSANLEIQSDTTLKGVNEYTTKLQFSGKGASLTCKGGYVQLYDLFLLTVPVKPLYFTAGTKGIYSDSMPGRPYFGQNIVMYNVRVQGFETLVEGNGYYWKFYNCSFHNSKYAFNNVSSNNLSFFGCKFVNAQDFIRSFGGNGPISLFGCSLERWSGAAITPISGGSLAVVMSGCYSEGAPTIDNTGTGLSDFKSAIVFSGSFTSISFTGNTFQLQGIRRLFSVTNPVVITSTGNTFWYETGASTTEYIYSISDLHAILHAQDLAIPVASLGVGKYTTSNFISTSNISGYDPITKKQFKRSD